MIQFISICIIAAAMLTGLSAITYLAAITIVDSLAGMFNRRNRKP